MTQPFRNPYRPSAGHSPPFLAGRDSEKVEFSSLLDQQQILENVVLTGLRGIGKTVLLEEFRNMGGTGRWAWVGSDISEASGSQTEEKLVLRVITDLATLTSQVSLHSDVRQPIGFLGKQEETPHILSYERLLKIYDDAPGLASDKLKAVLRLAWQALSEKNNDLNGIVFAYDEAQNFSDNAGDGEHPLSLFLDVFQALQREGYPFLLVLTGLPTLFPKLVEARTYAERMFRAIELTSLTDDASRDAIIKPIEIENCPVRFTPESVDLIVEVSNGYPYFIQFICKEIYDIWTEDVGVSVAMKPIMAKLDRDFFAGRWDKATDRQRDLMRLISALPNSDKEFTIQETVEASNAAEQVKSFSASHVTQILKSLMEKGLIYRNRHGKYMFAVPLMADFIRRQQANA